MAKPVIGMGAILGIAEESTYGTAVTPATHWARVFESGLRERRSVEVIPHLSQGASGVHTTPLDFAEFGIEVAGTIRAPLYYDDFATALLLKHTLGAVSTTGSGPYEHTFDFDVDGVSGLTVQQQYGQHSSVSVVRAFEGIVLNTMELDITPGQVVRATFGCIGEAAGAPGSMSGTASLSANSPLLPHQAVLTWNSTAFNILSGMLTFDKKLTRRPRVGSQFTQEPWVSDFCEIRIRITREYLDNDLVTAYRANTQSDGTIVLTGTGNHLCTINFHNAVIVEHDYTTSGPGIITETVELRALASASERGLQIVMQNDNSGALS